MNEKKEESKRKVEAWVRGLVEEKLVRQRKSAMKKLRPLMEKRRKGEKLSEEDIEKAMSVTCWKHLAFCCSVEKKCGRRDQLLRALGLTKKDYADYKKLCEGIFWLMLAERKII